VNDLKHYGIPGQKWGVRRFQNDDGSLKPSGKARYNTDLTKKKAVDMDDDDLNKSNKRLQAEQQYNNLTGRPYKNASSKTDTLIKTGSSAVGSFLAVAGVMAIKDYATGKKVSVGKILVPGLIAAFGGAVGSLTTTYGGQVNKGGKV
jgi:hypothetical protein